MDASSAARAGSTEISLEYLIAALIKFNASDLHLKAGRPPIYRINGKLVPAKMRPLTAPELDGMLLAMLSPRQKADLEQKLQVDLSLRFNDLGRFRCNIYYQRGTLSAAVRLIPIQVPRLEDLGVPSVVKELVQRQHGIFLITGGTGCGKSTTLAAILHHLNETQPIHIITIEDPIEFIHHDQKAAITQRELGSDAISMHEALIAGLRQDPDVIVVGEMRDYETMKVALTAAETGHLVLSTLHTVDARGTIERIIDMVPPAAQNQTRVQLGTSLIGVMSQQLVMRADKKGRALAAEVMVNSPAIESLILENRLERIQELLAGSSSYYQMQTMNQALLKLCQAEVITSAEAIKSSMQPDELNQLLSGIVRD